jgi:hypothetical protein
LVEKNLHTLKHSILSSGLTLAIASRYCDISTMSKPYHHRCVRHSFKGRWNWVFIRASAMTTPESKICSSGDRGWLSINKSRPALRELKFSSV